MKLTESMLRDLVATPLTVEEIGELLTMAGFELEEIFEAEGEKVLDVNVMANRGDGASVLGLARELLAKDVQARPTALYERLAGGYELGDEDARDVESRARIAVETPDCTRYACRVFEGLSNGESPDWVQERLRKVGQRPISLLVDLTNYVMLETGQPLHAFDLDALAGPEIIVRTARSGERITTLDGVEHELNGRQMMVCDKERPVAVAGVMGGEETEVGPGTTRCLLESAHFCNSSVRRTRRELGIQTEASYRFERWVDPAGVVRALNRFADLLHKATGDRPVPGVIDLFPSPPVPGPVLVRVDRASRLLGTPVTSDIVRDSLTALGFRVTPSGDGAFDAVPPSWRNDVVREVDVIEEVGRVHGYDKIPEEPPIGSTPIGGAHGLEAFTDRLRQALLLTGLSQAVSHSLRDVHPLDPRGARTIVRTPHSPETAHLRNSVLPSLSDAVVRNGGQDVHLFELGRVFPEGGETAQVGVVSVGSLGLPHWDNAPVPHADFFSLKETLTEAYVRVGVPFTAEAPSVPDPRLHPTRQATIPAGVMGQIHPDLAEALGLPAVTVLAELDVPTLFALRDEGSGFRPLHRFPAARRDIAVEVPKVAPYSQWEAAIREAAGDELEDLRLFDLYEGRGITEGHHSLAFALTLRKAGTFTDEEANQVRDAAVAALERLGAKLR